MYAGNAASAAYEWPQGTTSAFCFTIDVDAESPYQWSLPEGAPAALGQIEQRLFGPRVGIWRLLDLLDRYDIRATMFVPGLVAKNHPELLPAFVERGHEIGLHGYFHEIATEAGPLTRSTWTLSGGRLLKARPRPMASRVGNP